MLCSTIIFFPFRAVSGFQRIRSGGVYFRDGGGVERAAHSGDVVAGRTYCHQHRARRGAVAHVRTARVRGSRRAREVGVRRENGRGGRGGGDRGGGGGGGDAGLGRRGLPGGGFAEEGLSARAEAGEVE